jgi:CHAT domain-containing protein/tetratricopeptide (TPR) repeat protein
LAALVIAVLAALFPASERCFARQDDYREEPQFLQRQQALEAKRAEALRQMQKLGKLAPQIQQQMAELQTLRYEDAFVGEDPLSFLYQRPLSIELPYVEKDQPSNIDAAVRNLDRMLKRLQAQGDQARSEAEFQSVLTEIEKTLGMEHPEVAPVITDLARLYVSQDDLARAEPLLKRAQDIVRKAQGEGHANYAPALYNLAELYKEKGEYDHALALYQQALSVAEKTEQDPTDPSVAAALNNLGVIHALKGEFNLAIPLYERARKLYLQARGSVLSVDFKLERNIAVTLANAGLAAWQSGDKANAVQWLSQAHEKHDKTIWVAFNSMTESQQRIWLQQLSRGADVLMSLHQEFAPENSAAASLALTVVLQRKGRSLDAMTEAMATLGRSLLKKGGAAPSIPTGVLPPLKSQLDEFKRIQAKLAHLWLSGPRAGNDGQFEAEKADLETQERVLRAKLSERAEGQKTAEYLATIQRLGFKQRNARIAEFLQRGGQADLLDRVQKVLPAEIALVEFVRHRPFEPTQRAKAAQRQWLPARYAAYVLRSKGAPVFVDLGEASVIDQRIVALRRSLSEPGNSSVLNNARQLDERLMRPVRALLGDTRTVLLAPDGALHLVPFGVLRDEQHRFLIEDFHFTYLTSGSDLLRLSEHDLSRQKAVIMANPDFGIATGEWTSFTALPGTVTEAKAILALLPEGKLLLGKHATEAALKRLQGPRILHLATHGFYLSSAAVQDDDNTPGRGAKVVATTAPSVGNTMVDSNAAPPMIRAGLSLAGANKLESGTEDGILTALEASGLDLWGTQLVVLSACETGVGELQSGEGVYGLRRAFAIAGAESQLVSLWKVDDAATKDLMVDFYRRLFSGSGRSEALRQAQLSMLHSQDRQHAYFWASFIPIGAWTALENR